MPHRGRTTAILVAVGVVVVLAVAVVTFWADIVWFFQSDSQRIQGKWSVPMVIDGQAVPVCSSQKMQKTCTFYVDGWKMCRYAAHCSILEQSV